jgi:hypothetical protein
VPPLAECVQGKCARRDPGNAVYKKWRVITLGDLASDQALFAERNGNRQGAKSAENAKNAGSVSQFPTPSTPWVEEALLWYDNLAKRARSAVMSGELRGDRDVGHGHRDAGFVSGVG